MSWWYLYMSMWAHVYKTYRCTFTYNTGLLTILLLNYYTKLWSCDWICQSSTSRGSVRMHVVVFDGYKTWWRNKWRLCFCCECLWCFMCFGPWWSDVIHLSGGLGGARWAFSSSRAHGEESLSKNTEPVIAPHEQFGTAGARKRAWMTYACYWLTLKSNFIQFSFL